MYGVEKRVVNVLAAAHERDKIRAGCKVFMDLADESESNGASKQTGQQPAVVIKSVTAEPHTEEKRNKFLGIF